MKIDSLIFDLDGTLWDSSEGIVATWALVLEHYPEIHKKVTAEELASNFGLPLDQIARNMFPEQTEALRMRLMDECCEQENIYLAEHGGILYPKLERPCRSFQRNIRCLLSAIVRTAISRAFTAAITQRSTLKIVNVSV